MIPRLRRGDDKASFHRHTADDDSLWLGDLWSISFQHSVSRQWKGPFFSYICRDCCSHLGLEPAWNQPAYLPTILSCTNIMVLPQKMPVATQHWVPHTDPVAGTGWTPFLVWNPLQRQRQR